MTVKSQINYKKDFYAWALQTANLVREGNFAEVDRKNLAEEIESMGKRDRRELINRLATLLAHLLRWQFQSERRGNSWINTIKTQRFEVADLLADSPSLQHELQKQLEHAYVKALLIAVAETGLKQETFPAICPFSLQQCFDSQFFPDSET